MAEFLTVESLCGNQALSFPNQHMSDGQPAEEGVKKQLYTSLLPYEIPLDFWQEQLLVIDPFEQFA